MVFFGELLMRVRCLRLSVFLVCLGLLYACDSESPGLSPESTFALTKMTKVELGTQTFQQRDLAYDGIVPAAGESRYVYKDKLAISFVEDKPILFTSTDGKVQQSESMIVTSLVDINDRFSALSMLDATIQLQGWYHTGHYVLIQEKVSGNLYPVIIEDEILLSQDINENLSWYSSHLFSNIADQSRLYINNTLSQQLLIAEFIDGAFVVIDKFNYQGYRFWINKKGDILAQSNEDKNTMIWLDRGTLSSVQAGGLAQYLPFLHGGDFVSKNTSDNKIYKLIKSTTISPVFDVTWKTVAASYIPDSRSVKRAGYEMTTACELYYFDVSNPIDKQINFISHFSASNGQLAIAGQNSLFCVHAATSDLDALPIITQVNTNNQRFDTFSLSEGTVLDAIQRLRVISDEQVMFSEVIADSFNEYYIDVVAHDEQIMSVIEPSLVGLQTLPE